MVLTLNEEWACFRNRQLKLFYLVPPPSKVTPKYTCVSVGKSSGSMRVWTIVVVALQVKVDEREEEEDDDNGSWP